MNNVIAGEFARIGLAHHLHDNEGINGATLGERPRQPFGTLCGHWQLVHIAGNGGISSCWQPTPVTLSPYSNANQKPSLAKTWLDGLARHSPPGGEAVIFARLREHARSS